MSDITIASTWGFDQLLPRNISVINEKKLYSAPNQEDLFRFDGADSSAHRLSHHHAAHHPDPPTHHTPEVTPEILPPEPTELEHEFIFFNDWASKVQVAGEFTSWKPQLDLKRDGNKWSLKHTFPIIKGEVQRY